MSASKPQRVDLSFEKLFDLTQRLDFFNNLHNHQTIKVLKLLEGEVFIYGSDDIIIEEDAANSDLFIILSGSVSVQKGKEQFIAVGTIKAGDFFGEVSFVVKSKRMASVIAKEKTIVLRLSHEKFNELELLVQSKIKDKIMIKLITRLNSMNVAVSKLLTDPN